MDQKKQQQPGQRPGQGGTERQHDDDETRPQNPSQGGRREDQPRQPQK